VHLLLAVYTASNNPHLLDADSAMTTAARVEHEGWARSTCRRPPSGRTDPAAIQKFSAERLKMPRTSFVRWGSSIRALGHPCSERSRVMDPLFDKTHIREALRPSIGSRGRYALVSRCDPRVVEPGPGGDAGGAIPAAVLVPLVERETVSRCC